MNIIAAGCYGINEVSKNEECQKARQEWNDALASVPTWAWVVLFLLIGGYLSFKGSRKK